MAAEPLRPDVRARLGLQATGLAPVVDHEEVPVVGDRRGHVGRVLPDVPGHVRLGDVARPVRADAEYVQRGVPAGHHQHAPGVDEAGDELVGRPVDDPVLLARVGVVGGHAPRAAQHELFLAGQVEDDRWAVAPDAVGAVDAPSLGAGGLVERDDVGQGILVAVEDDEPLVQQQGATEAVHGVQLAGRLAPQLLAVDVVTDDPHALGGPFEDAHPHALAVRRGRAGGVGVQVVLPFQRRAKDRPLPEHLAVGAVEAQQEALLLPLVAGGHEDAVAPHHGRGVPLPADGHLPQDVLRRAPAEGHTRLAAGAVSPRPAPRGPFLRQRGRRCRQPPRRPQYPQRGLRPQPNCGLWIADCGLPLD